MPEEKTELEIELAKQAAAQKEFDEAVNEIMDKTDEEIAEIEEARKAKGTDGAGEPNEDQAPPPDTAAKPADPEVKPDVTSDPATPASSATVPAATTAEIEQLKSELQKEKQKTSSWDGRIRAANDKVKLLEAEITELKAQLKTKVDTKVNEQEQTDQEIMETFKKTFPELTEVIAILEKKIALTTPAEPANSPAEPEVKPGTTPQVPETKPAEESGINEHYTTTRKAHPDLDEAVNSGVLLTWINTQPDYVRPYLESVYYGKNDNGTSKQVIDMVAEFKNKSGWKSQIPGTTAKDEKLNSMLESEGDSTGAKTTGPDKNDFDGAAKEAFK